VNVLGAAGMPSRKVADPRHDEPGGPLEGMPKHGFPKSGKGRPPVGWMVATLLISTGVAVVVVVRISFSLRVFPCRLSS